MVQWPPIFYEMQQETIVEEMIKDQMHVNG